MIRNDWMWRATVWQCGILGASTGFLALVMKNQISIVSVVFSAVAMFNFSCLILLWLNRKNNFESAAGWVYFFNILFSGIAIGINQNHWLTEKASEVFFGYKIMALMVAIQAPPKKWAGFSSLVIIFLIPTILFSSWSIEQRRFLSSQEPWFTLTLILSCIFVYYQRLQTLKLLHEKVHLEASINEWKKFAQFLLGLQHLVNSPLQIIENATELIEKKHPETSPLPEKIHQSLARLRRIGRILSKSQDNLHWEEHQMALSIEELEAEMHRISQSVQIERNLQ